MTAVTELRNQALLVAGSLEPELLTGEQAAAVVEDLAIADKALGSALMFAALRVAQTNAWQGQGFASSSDWLAAKAGISVYEANRLLGTAKKAERLPKTKDAMKKGNLSPDQADAVTDGATADPDAEDDLLASAANDTHKKLREEAAKRKAAATDSAERERRIRARRSLRTGTDAEGAFWGRLYGPGADAARFEAMLRPFEELIFRQHRTAGRRDTYENRRYDAFFLMLAFYQHLATAAQDAAQTDTADETQTETADETETEPSPDPAPTPETDEPPPNGSPPSESPPSWSPPWDPDQVVPLPDRVPGGNNVKVIVNVDHTALLRGHAVAGETVEIAGVGPVSVEAVREILRDDPFLAVVVRKGRDVVNVAHHGRGLNVHQRTAIEANGLRCTNIACNRTVALQIDHRVPYADDPITDLNNQDPLCPCCHPLKTHHGHHLEHGTGRRRFLPPGHPNNPLTRTNDETAAPMGPNDPCPTNRPLTPDEEKLVEARLRDHLARRGTPVDEHWRRIDQPRLC